MKPVILPVPLDGLLLRIELVPVTRKSADDFRVWPTRRDIHDALRHGMGPRLLQDIGIDSSRRD